MQVPHANAESHGMAQGQRYADSNPVAECPHQVPQRFRRYQRT
jgi:hypothetical protein